MLCEDQKQEKQRESRADLTAPDDVDANSILSPVVELGQRDLKRVSVWIREGDGLVEGVNRRRGAGGDPDAAGIVDTGGRRHGILPDLADDGTKERGGTKEKSLGLNSYGRWRKRSGRSDSPEEMRDNAKGTMLKDAIV